MIRCDYCDKEMHQLDESIFKCFTCNTIKEVYRTCVYTYLIPKNSNFVFNMQHVSLLYKQMINDKGNLPQHIVCNYNKQSFIKKLYWDAKIFEETISDGFDSKIITPQNIDQKIKTILTLG